VTLLGVAGGMSKIKFLGFPEGYAERVLRGLKIAPRGELPGLVTFENVIALPNHEVLYDLKGRMIGETWVPSAKAAFPSSPPQVSVPEEPAIISTDVLFAGRFNKQYGHLIIDAMNRFWALTHVDPSTPVLFLSRHDRSKFVDIPFLKTIFEFAGVPTERIVDLRGPTLLRRVIMPGPSLTETVVYHEHQSAHLTAAERMGVRQLPRERFNKPVYLSRSSWLRNRRYAETESILEQKLLACGYSIVHPQTLPLAEQIAWFSYSPRIVGLTGSALHTALFALPLAETKIAVLTHRSNHSRWFLVDLIKNHQAFYLKCIDIDRNRDDPNKWLVEVDLDVDQAVQQLDQAGFL